jgi:hypothetical protein
MYYFLSCYAVQFSRYVRKRSVSIFRAKRVIPGSNKQRWRQEFCLEKTEIARPYGRPRCTWEDNLKMDFKEIG